MTFQVILGALLHDIGIFAQRAGECLSEAQQLVAQRCCPVSREGFSDHHVLHGAKFVQDVLGTTYQETAEAILYHHRHENADSSRNALLVAVADCLSNGGVRSSHATKPSPDDDSARLCSIFTRLSSSDQKLSAHFFPLKSIAEDLGNHIPEKEPTSTNGQQYADLWASFVTEAKRLDVSDKHRLLRQLMALLEKYTLFLPYGAYSAGNDVALFHHLKTTAAIASCLTQLELGDAALANILSAVGQGGPNDSLDQEAFYLVGSDLSGIQSFIYSVASKGALKGLRGRSVYLSALVEIVAESLLQELGLNPCNMIYCGGGHAYFLAPKSNSFVAIMKAKQDAVNHILNKAHRGQLALAVAWQPMRFRDFCGSAYVNAWESLGASLAREKRRKACQFLSDEPSVKNVLGPFEIKGDEKVCVVCGDWVPGTTRDEGDEAFRCQMCQSFERLSKDVARAQYLSMHLTKSTFQGQQFSDCADILQALGGCYEFYEQPDNPGSLLLLNSTDFLGKDHKYLGFRFMAKHTPLTDDNQLEDLESLAGNACGLKRWGVLRADVDNLGKVMREGVSGADNTITRLSMLSYLIGLFFSAQPQLLAHKPPYQRGISLVYAGGDDLCVIGAWSMLPGLAESIQKDFSAFTSGALHLSAGIFLAPSMGFPVYQAAALAGKAESYAKEKGRNRLCFFDAPVPWSDLQQIAAIKDSLVDLLQIKKCPRSLLSMLYAGYQDQQLAESGKTSRFRVWRLFYAFGRLMQRNKHLMPEIKKLEVQIIRNLWMPMHSNIGIRWAEYLTRGKENAIHEQPAKRKAASKKANAERSGSTLHPGIGPQSDNCGRRCQATQSDRQ